MVFDTDIFIWLQRGNQKAAAAIEHAKERYLSIYSYMELLQCAQDKKQHAVIKDFLNKFEFIVLPLTENIGHRALIYLEEYAFVSQLGAGDALIAATTVENNMALASGNAKHFKPLKDLKFHVFTP